MSLRLVHLSDLHLGFRAFPGVERGWNRRERDVASAFHRAIQMAARLEPKLVLITGDLFHGPDPPSTAFLTLTRGLRTLQSLVPGVSILVIAGERDTPRAPADPGPVAVLDTMPGIEAAAGAARAVRFRETGIHALLVPHRAVQGPPRPELRPDRDAAINLLLLRGRPGPDAGDVAVDPGEWSYVALGGDHSARVHHPRVRTAGSLERIGWDPWAEATDEKGFMVFDLESGEGEFHPVRSRPVVDLAPVRCDAGDPGAGTRRLRHLLEEIPGGVESKLLRVRLEGRFDRPEEGVEAGLLQALQRRAAYLEVRIAEPFHAEPLSQREDADAASTPGGASDTSSHAPTPLRWRQDPWDHGLHFVTAHETFELERLGQEIAAAPVVDESSLEGLLWAGGGVRELLDAWRGLAATDPATAVADSFERPADSEPPASPESPALSEAEGGAEATASSPRELEEALRELREDWIEAEGEVEARTLQWASDRQEAETRLQHYRDQARLLRRRLSSLDGPEATCPTCAQPLTDAREGLRSRLREEWETLVQDGQWWKRRREQLEDRPEELKALEARALRLRAGLEDLDEELHRVGTAPEDDTAAGAASEAAPAHGGVPIGSEGSVHPLLRRAGNHLRRWSEGRLSGLALGPDGELRVVEGIDERAPTLGETAGLAMILQLAFWEEARARGRLVPGGLLLRGLDPRGADPLMPLLERLPLDRMVVIVLLPPRAPVPGHVQVRSLVVREPGAPGGLRRTAVGPVRLRLEGSGTDGSEPSAPR